MRCLVGVRDRCAVAVCIQGMPVGNVWGDFSYETVVISHDLD
jgi:hypothetical protein